MSQHLVSAIELLGLVVGLLGFFYLSIDYFGTSGPNLVRPLLSAFALGVFIAVFSFTSVLDQVLGVPRAQSQPIVQLVAVIGVSAVGYLTGYISQKTGPFLLRDLLINVGFLLIGIGASFAFPIVSGDLSAASYLRLMVLVVPSGAILIFLIALPGYLKDRAQTVKNIGLTATIIAILAQFLPPALDLLNIPMTK